MDISAAGAHCRNILQQVGRVIVGREDVLRKFLTAVVANGHILIEDFPGLAKTLMAKAFSAALGCDFARVQFTPDLLPSDIIGSYVYNQKTNSFELRRGPIFTNILLADEINRSPPKTQAALLEAMMERQVTIEGNTFRLGPPFIVIATQNPIELEGVYPLPEAQLDRFAIKIGVGYPSMAEELEILARRRERRSDEWRLESVVDRSTLLEIQRMVEDVEVHPDIEEYIVRIARSTREHQLVEMGVSPRGTQMLWHLCRAHALVNGRDYVIPDDVKAMAVPCLSHRIVLRAGTWVQGIKPQHIIEELLLKTPVPRVV